MRQLALAVSLLVPASAPAQDAKAQRDLEALQLVAAAHRAMGAPAFQQNFVTRGVIEDDGANSPQKTFVWKVSGDEIRRELSVDGKVSVYVSGRGKPEVKRGGAVKSVVPHVALSTPALHLPAVLLAKYLSDSKYLIKVADADVEVPKGQACVEVSRDGDEVARILTPQLWCFDKASGFPKSVKYRAADNSPLIGYIEATIEFSDFRAVGGVLHPFRLTNHEQGGIRNTAIVSAVSVNESIAASEFDAVGGGR